MGKIKFRPIHVIWHITNSCFFNCKYCFTNSYPNYNSPPKKSHLQTIVKRINENKSIKNLSIIGGEPLLINELPEVIENLRKDISVNIDSTLIGIKDKYVDSFKRVLFSTTIDSIDEYINTKTRPNHSSKETIKNIEFLLNKGIRVQVVIVVTKNNVKTIEKTARFLLNLGVERISINQIRMVGRALDFDYEYFYDNSKEIKNDIATLLKRLIKEYKKSRVLANNWYCDEIFDIGYELPPTCSCALFKVCIDWNGYLYPCELMPFYWREFEKVYRFKRINLKKSSISDIFNHSSLFNFFREKILIYPPTCSKCDYKKKCNHGCRFYSFLFSTNLLSQDPLCKKFISLYDVIGYQNYSPFSKQGIKRLKGGVADYLKKNSKILGKNIYDIGCGGGVWTFYLEDLGKKLIGIDNNQIMILIAQDYKKLHHKKSEFIFSDILNVNYQKSDTILMLDNLVLMFSKKDLTNILEKIKNKTKRLILELNKNKLKEGVQEYTFNSFDIREIVLRKNKNICERIFLNKQTGAEFKLKNYDWTKRDLINFLKKQGDVFEDESNNSYLIRLDFHH
ncbi:MAG: radical SAM protein [Nanoarchaeota archaeon]|nr:radical SAM protein [Nanoarchaeota archaeon]